MTEKNENSGETPVVRPLTDVPRDVLDELTEAFEKRGGPGNESDGASAADRAAPPNEADDVVVIDGFDLVADDELTRARKPPLVIDDTELTGPVARPGDETFADDDSVVRGAGRFRLRRIAVRRAEGKRRLRIVLWVVTPIVVIGLVLGLLASPLFGVRTIRVDGARYTAQATLDLVNDQIKGKSIFSLDLGKVEKTLLADPWVRDAQAKRRFPSTVVVDIAERKPVAWFLGSDNQARVIDIDGRVLDVLVGQPTGYTKISGQGPDLPAGGQADDVFTAAAQVSASLPPEIAPLMLEMGVVGGADLTMTLTTGAVVTFGRPTDLRAKMISLVLVLRRTDPASLKGIDLSSGDPILAGK